MIYRVCIVVDVGNYSFFKSYVRILVFNLYGLVRRFSVTNKLVSLSLVN